MLKDPEAHKAYKRHYYATVERPRILELRAERMLAALAEYPMMSTGELTKMLNITSQECNNATRRLAGQLDIFVVSPKVRRFKLKPKVAASTTKPCNLMARS